ncbi:MAG: sigma-54-dependent Fis family transcriptional regulator [Nitrospirae bacterium]|nr:sigma-54-dependent Fis family transcriptional regulator [Nitrospirota bacterium]
MNPKAVLIVDDEPEILESVALICNLKGFKTLTADSGAKAIDVFSNEPTPVIVCDNVLPDIEGVELLKEFRQIFPEVQMIMITGKGTISVAVSAMKAGVFDFITKPFDPEYLIQLILRAGELCFALTEKNALKEEFEKTTSEEMIGSHLAMKKLLGVISVVSPTESTVLIEGESGTGKELVARLIHKRSPRGLMPFIPVDCGAIPEGLVESELFGHEKGAFTGALSQKIGRFQRAEGGTLFLDEIGSLPLSSQAKLLRALQEKVIERVGGQKLIPIDVRFIAATNISLYEAVKKKRFREDLYYRLNVIRLEVPPLRERLSDIPALSMHFVQKHRSKTNSIVTDISKEALKVMMQHPWHGNIRELENVIEHALIMARAETIMPHDISSLLKDEGEEVEGSSKLDDMERAMLLRAIKEAGGNKYRAAKILGIQRSSLYSKLKKFGIAETESV